MKKIITTLLPLVLILCAALLIGNLISSITITPTVLIMIALLIGLVVILVWRKGSDKKIDPEEQAQIDALSAGAFSDDPRNRKQFDAAVSYYATSRPKAAISKLNKLLAQCKNDTDTYAAYMLLAMCHCSAQIYGDAVQAYNKAILIRPSSELAAKIGFCYHRLGELKEAKSNYEFATELDSRNTDAWASLASVWVAIGDYDEALDSAETALELDSRCASALATSAICYGVLDEEENYRHYFSLATENGYTAEKIEYTVNALKKR